MKSYLMSYDHIKSFERLDKIINGSYTYDEVDNIPLRDKLTYDNGFYVNCSALFVDIRGSSKLPAIHKRPKLAKLYRSYISEVVAVINGNPHCVEVNIVGDCVSGVFDTKSMFSINRVFVTAFEISSLINVMNYKFKRNGIETIEIGIGISYGRALMIKAGYNGSGINDVVWMGDVVNEASKLCSYGNKEVQGRIVVSSIIYNNLNEDNQSFLMYNRFPECYHGNVNSKDMEDWYRENCK